MKRFTLISHLFTLLLCLDAQAIERDKLAHFGAGWAIGTTCNIAFHEISDDLTPAQRAVFCAIASFGVGAGWEFINRRESSPDPMDVIATGAGGIGAALFTITIDF